VHTIRVRRIKVPSPCVPLDAAPHLFFGRHDATLELAALGAVVTAADASEEALEAARERGPSIVWVHAEPGSLPAELRRGRFDLVFAGEGVLARVPELGAFATGIAAALRGGADLLLYEEHPVALCVDGMLHWRENYFAEDIGLWRLGQVVTALARAGLTVRALEGASDGEALPAAAFALDVRVSEAEGLVQALLDEVHDRAVEQAQACAVNEHRHAAVFEHGVPRLRAVGVVDHVGKAGAAGLAHTEPQADAVAAGGEKGLDPICSGFSQ